MTEAPFYRSHHSHYEPLTEARRIRHRRESARVVAILTTVVLVGAALVVGASIYVLERAL